MVPHYYLHLLFELKTRDYFFIITMNYHNSIMLIASLQFYIEKYS